MKKLILLHGAMGCKDHWNDVEGVLASMYELHNLNFPGHDGKESDTEIGFQTLIDFVKDYVHQNKLEKFTICGYSLGGYVALRLASLRLEGLEKVITIATKMNWSPEIAEEEISKLTLENLQPIAQKLEREHGPHWKNLILITAKILEDIGNDPITIEEMEGIPIMVGMMIGEWDKMVTVAESQLFATSVDGGRCFVLPEQGHLLQRMDRDTVLGYMIEIIKN